MLTAEDLVVASEALAERDPVIARLYASHGPCTLGPRRRTHFEALARAIAFQQLSGTSAAAIWDRVAACMDDPVTAEKLLAVPEEDLRGAGLSRTKVDSMRDLAARVAEGSVPLSDIARLGDEAIVEQLVTVRGIGPWTAHMFLIFQLRRGDVWPVGDYGVRKGYGVAYHDGELPTPGEMKVLGEPFRPYRSVAAWYLWRVADTVTV